MRIIFNKGEEDEKIYIQARVKAKYFRQALDLIEKNDLDNINGLTMDEMMGYICDVFQKQFTIQDIYDGLFSDELVPLFHETLAFVIGHEEDEQAKKKMLAD